MGLSRQEYWSGLPFPSPEDLFNPGMEPRSPSLQADSLPSELQGRSVKQSIHRYKGKWLLWNVLRKYIFKLWYSINHGLLWWLRGKETTWKAGDVCSTPRWGRSLGEGDATHSRILAWELYGRRSLAVCIQSIGSQKSQARLIDNNNSNQSITIQTGKKKEIIPVMLIGVI